MRRRDLLPALAASGALSQLSELKAQRGPEASGLKEPARKGRLKQTVTAGVFGRGGMSFEDGCKLAASLGIVGYDLRGPADWPILKKYGLTPSMYPPGPGGTIPDPL